MANRVSDKLTHVHDRIYCCRSGSAADTQAVSDYVRHFLYQHALQVEASTVKAAAICSEIFATEQGRSYASIICAGWDPVDGGSVYCLPLGGTCETTVLYWWKWIYIYGLCDATTRKTRRKMVGFVKLEFMARDGSSGGVIRMVVITEDGVERKFISGDKLPYMNTIHLSEESKVI